MAQELITIKPHQITLNIKYISVGVPYMVLNEFASVKVLCLDEDRQVLTKYDFELTGDDYKIWRDDQDLINYVCEKYNFVLEEEEST